MSEPASDPIAAIEEQWRRERPDLDLAAMVVFGRFGAAGHGRPAPDR
ncbi:hypothetical protein [Nocardia carnea]|nr:hypothetical protein [Nocardia carnea]